MTDTMMNYHLRQAGHRRIGNPSIAYHVYLGWFEIGWIAYALPKMGKGLAVAHVYVPQWLRRTVVKKASLRVLNDFTTKYGGLDAFVTTRQS